MNSPTTLATVDQLFVLPEDVLFVASEELAPEVLQTLDDTQGHLAVTRPGYRTPARLVDSDTAELLQLFRKPSTIVDAVLRFSKLHGADPESTLDDAWPVLQLFADSRTLVPEGSQDAQGFTTSLAVGQRLHSMTIMASLQCTHDTEVYQARIRGGALVALKIEQPDAPKSTANAITHEADQLRRLNDGNVPELVEIGTYRNRRFLVTSWFNGVPVTARAAEIRLARNLGWQRRLHVLACRVLDAFVQIHSAAVVQGDVHPNNILVGENDSVQVIDFGQSQYLQSNTVLGPCVRAGLARFFDPDCAQRLLDEKMPGSATPASERYALAALVYEIITGSTYIEFSAEVQTVYRDIVHANPRPFSSCGFEPWPLTEQVLVRALAKQESHRYATMSEFRDAFQLAQPPSDSAVRSTSAEATRRAIGPYVARTSNIDQTLKSRFIKAPLVAIDRGAAGYAWFLYRLSQLEERPDWLAAADIWCRRAAACLDEPDAFHTPEGDSDAAVQIDDCSLVHRTPGVHFVHALVCLSRGDHSGLLEQARRYTAASAGSGEIIDVALGRAGTLIGLTTLHGALSIAGLDQSRQMVQDIRIRMNELLGLLHDPTPPGLVALQPHSFAHGWAGIVYAVLRAAQTLDLTLDARSLSAVQDRLRDIAEHYRMLGKALHQAQALPHDQRAHLQQHLIPGWCNGAAGAISLFSLAHARLGDDYLSHAAECAALTAASHPDRHAHLCCGLAGRIFGLLNMHQYSGEQRWLDAAQGLAQHLHDPVFPGRNKLQKYSLFWGPLGSTLALAELQHPEQACMPVFGELWSLPHSLYGN